MGRIVVVIVVVVLTLVMGGRFASRYMNSGVVRELREEPDGERAQKVMLITLPSGKEIPVNYLREGDRVYAGADFPWWRELKGEGVAVTLLIQGETLRGRARAVLDQPDWRAEVFAKLRPTAPSWTGTFVVVELAEEAP